MFHVIIVFNLEFLERRSSSIPRDFHRNSAHATRSNAHYAAYRADPRHLSNGATVSGFLGSPYLGTRPPRVRSLDLSQHHHQQQTRTVHHPRERRSTVAGTRHPNHWISGAEQMDEEDPSTETAALLNLTEELMRLRQGLKQAKEANVGRVRFT